MIHAFRNFQAQLKDTTLYTHANKYEKHMSLTYIQSKNTIKKFFHAPIKIYNINTYNINIISGFNKKRS